MKHIILKTITHMVVREKAGWKDSPARAAFLRVWPGEPNSGDRAIAQAIADRANYGWSIEWYKINHFVPQMNYPNKCAVDFSPGKPSKEALDVLRRSDSPFLHGQCE
jgi:hypothetical protein